ncbi:MAG: hypothetical protein GBAus27B_000546 [Mycoplasmataceae bacterium]|nr:MAG: hypothetical protein GBAus27B_000546 [Mycoplasmataceae bacterium]
MARAQEWLDKYFPKNGKSNHRQIYGTFSQSFPIETIGKTRQEITDLIINHQNLEGELDLSDFINLKTLDCGGNKLTKIVVNKCQNLSTFVCNDNKLTSLDLRNNKNLEWIYCACNSLNWSWILKTTP